MYILVIGNPMEGFEFVGPFASQVEAAAYGEQTFTNIEWWTAEIISVGEVNTNTTLQPINAICSCGHPWTDHVQNVHRVWVCTQCGCRNMNPPSGFPKEGSSVF